MKKYELCMAQPLSIVRINGEEIAFMTRHGKDHSVPHTL